MGWQSDATPPNGSTSQAGIEGRGTAGDALHRQHFGDMPVGHRLQQQIRFVVRGFQSLMRVHSSARVTGEKTRVVALNIGVDATPKSTQRRSRSQ